MFRIPSPSRTIPLPTDIIVRSPPPAAARVFTLRPVISAADAVPAGSRPSACTPAHRSGHHSEGCGTDDAVLFIQSHHAMHLAGKSNRTDVFTGNACLPERVFDSRYTGIPPDPRILLGISTERTLEVIFDSIRRKNAPRGGKNDGFQARVARINTKQTGRQLPSEIS